jgi:hypothetical protein
MCVTKEPGKAVETQRRIHCPVIPQIRTLQRAVSYSAFGILHSELNARTLRRATA